MNPQRRVRTVRRTAAAIAALVLVLALIGLFIGLPIPGVVAVPGLAVAVVAAITWLVTALLERRDAHRHAAQGQSWRPDASTAR